MNPVSVTNDRVATAVLVALSVATVWVVEVFPTQDGPAHIYIGYVLHHLLSGTPSPFGAYFEANINYQPNLLVYGIVAALTPVLPAVAIEKLIVSLIVAGIPLGGGAIARALGRPAFLGAAALVPIAFSFVLYIGFYNYCLSLVFCLLGVACWVRWHGSRHPGWLIALFVMSIAAYFSHLFPAANLVLIIGLASFFCFLSSVSAGAEEVPLVQRIWRALRSEALPPMVALVPVAATISIFLATYDSGPPIGLRIGLLERIFYLFGIETFDVFGPVDILLSLSLLIVGLAVFFERDRSVKLFDGVKGPWTFAFAMYVLIFLIVPVDIIGSTFVLARLMPFVYVLGIVFLLAGSFTLKQMKVMAAGFVFLATATLGLRSYQMNLSVDHSAEIREMGSYLDPESTLLVMGAVPFSSSGLLWRPEHKISSWWHWSAALSIEKNLVNLNIVQANYPIVPLAYRHGRNPFLLLPDQPVEEIGKLPRLTQIDLLYGKPHWLDIGRFERVAEDRLDYVMIWGDLEAFDRSRHAAKFEAIAQARFVPVDLGKARPYVRLYRRVPAGAPAMKLVP